ncbi:MAG: hypothetical protein ACRENC_01925, partial [Gemmatimonadaceae bacterium]
ANDAQTSLLLVNLSHSPVTTTVDDDSLPASLSGQSLRDLLSGKSGVSSGQELRVDLPPYGVRLLSP